MLEVDLPRIDLIGVDLVGVDFMRIDLVIPNQFSTPSKILAPPKNPRSSYISSKIP